MRFRLGRLALTALLLLVPGAGFATPIGSPVALSSLIADPEAVIVAGDKQFSGFSYAGTGDMPDASGVNVIAITDADGNFGLRFQGAFIDTASSHGGSDALIGYTVSTLDPGRSIIGASLAGNPTVLGCSGSVSVVDTFGFDPDLRLQIFDEGMGQRSSLDTIGFDPIQSFAVTKDILAFATKSSVTLSFVDQTYAQTVPEPAALLMLAVGLAGLGRAGHRRA